MLSNLMLIASITTCSRSQEKQAEQRENRTWVEVQGVWN